MVNSLLLFFWILIPIIITIEKVHRSAPAKDGLKYTEYALNVYFTAELILRAMLCPNKSKFIKTMLFWIDLAAVIPMYIEIAASQYIDIQSPKFRCVHILEVFRICKVFRVFRYNYALQVLVNTLKESLPELMLLVFLMTLLATMFSFCNFYVENINPDSPFKSIPYSLWWAFITMTTVSNSFL